MYQFVHVLPATYTAAQYNLLSAWQRHNLSATYTAAQCSSCIITSQ
jgi:hypothetical protein